MIKNKIFSLDRLLIAIVVIYSVMPIITRIFSSFLTTYSYMLILMLLVVMIVFGRGKESFFCYANILLPFIIYQIVIQFETEMSLIDWGYDSLYSLIPLILGYYIINTDNDRITEISRVFVIACIITTVTTIIGTINYPNASRYLATAANASDSLRTFYDWNNIGGYGFVYTIVLLYPLLIFASKQKLIGIMPTIICTMAILTLIICSEYTIALLLFMASSILFLVGKDMSVSNLIVLMLFVAILCFAFWEKVSDIFLLLGNSIQSENLSERLLAIAGGKSGLETTEDLRWVYISNAFESFLSQPLFGGLFSGNRVLSGHSFIIDFLSKYGLAGLGLIIWMYRKIYVYFYKRYESVLGYGYIIWFFVQTIILSIINTSMWLYVLALFGPVMIESLVKKNVNKRDEQC